VLGVVGAAGVYFAPGEPYPGFITIAGALHGMTIALLVSVFVTGESSVPGSMAWGALVSLLPSLTVFFAKGGWASWDAPFVVPTGVVNGAILGFVVRWLSRPRGITRS
jgi:hypothetical protein